ncbi:MAG: hypothetical protein A3H32_08000 [Betaproteobacteria bacterium RIFCSPLOWO2_02_FULL_63_19]|nr:MAG: hypothetical protein A3H32_08000 [Betaproteobacteria bacterium RIFCSPLOWO2_02_FULL_63_19]
MGNVRNIARILTLVAAGSTAGVALAQGPGYSQGQGGPGDGPGPGMMGAYGGPGFGRHHDMGPRMRGGHGPGPGYGAQRFGPGERMGGGRGAGRMLGRMARALGLSEDQRAKVRRIMEDTRRKNWDVIGQIRSERFNLREMMRADKVDPDAAVEQKRKIDDLRRQIMRARLDARNQVLALLTPEQREKARAFRQLRRERRGNG